MSDPTKQDLIDLLAQELTLEEARVLLASLDGKDFATSAKQDTGNTSLATIAGKDFATSAKQDTLIAKDFATQTTLAAILAKLIDAPATEATIEAIRALLAGTLVTNVQNFPATQTVDGTVSVDNFPATQPVSGTVAVSNLPATQDVQLTGSTAPLDIASIQGAGAEIESYQDSQPSVTVKEYTRAEGAAMIELYLESGEVRVRANGDPCTANTGVPLVEGDAVAFQVPSVSVYYVQESVITVVSR